MTVTSYPRVTLLLAISGASVMAIQIVRALIEVCP